VDDDSGRADVVGEVASFVHGEEIEAGIGSRQFFKLHQARQRATWCGRKAIQGYFGPESTQHAQVGGTRQSDRKTGGRHAKIATLPKAA